MLYETQPNWMKKEQKKYEVRKKNWKNEIYS